MVVWGLKIDVKKGIGSFHRPPGSQGWLVSGQTRSRIREGGCHAHAKVSLLFIFSKKNARETRNRWYLLAAAAASLVKLHFSALLRGLSCGSVEREREREKYVSERVENVWLFI